MIICKGAVLPAQATATVQVMVSGNAAVVEIVEIGACEGETKLAARVLGIFTFEEVSENGEGSVEVTVGFTLRSEGVLKVEAVESVTKAARELVIGHE